MKLKLKPFLMHCLLFLTVGILMSALNTVTPVHAQTETPNVIPSAAEVEIGDTLTFARLGANNFLLRPTNRTATVMLATPAHWQLVEGATLTLNISTLIQEAGMPSDTLFGGWLVIEFNNILLDTIPLEQNGPQTLNFTLPPAALLSENNRFPLSFRLETNFGCNSRQETIVTVQSDSNYELPHTYQTPTTDLRQLPWPIQQRSFLPDSAAIVIPDNPTPQEMEAVMTVAAGLGRMTSGTDFQLIRAGELTPEIQQAEHLILVGQQDNLPMLAEIPFPLAMMTAEKSDAADTAKPAAATAVTDDDGVLQMAVSPWNEAKVTLLISGKTETAVTKAAQALRYGQVRTGDTTNLAVITSYDIEQIEETTLRQTQTLLDLGYSLRTLQGNALQSTNFGFFIPPGQTIREEETAVFTLIYNHSALLDYEASGMIVKLNGQPIGSASFSEASTAVTTLPIDIPTTFLQPGDNTLTVETKIESFDNCSDLREAGSWLNIHPESTLYLPMVPLAEDERPMLTIRAYPQPMTYNSALSTTAFVLAQDDPVGWFTAVQVAFDMGRRVAGNVLDMHVFYGHDVPQVARSAYNFVVIGQASALPFVAELSPYLPGQFESGSNRINRDRLPVSYEIPDDTPLGYLQVLASPWQPDNAIYLIMGDSDTGLQNATRTLLSNRGRLNGDLAVIEPDQLFVTSSPQPETAVADTDLLVSAEDAAESDTDTPPIVETDAAVDTETAAAPPETAAAETAAEAAPAATATPNAAPARTQNASTTRSVPTLPLAVLALCTLILLGLGGYLYLSRRRQI